MSKLSKTLSRSLFTPQNTKKIEKHIQSRYLIEQLTSKEVTDSIIKKSSQLQPSNMMIHLNNPNVKPIQQIINRQYNSYQQIFKQYISQWKTIKQKAYFNDLLQASCLDVHFRVSKLEQEVLEEKMKFRQLIRQWKQMCFGDKIQIKKKAGPSYFDLTIKNVGQIGRQKQNRGRSLSNKKKKRNLSIGSLFLAAKQPLSQQNTQQINNYKMNYIKIQTNQSHKDSSNNTTLKQFNRIQPYRQTIKKTKFKSNLFKQSSQLLDQPQQKIINNDKFIKNDNVNQEQIKDMVKDVQNKMLKLQEKVQYMIELKKQDRSYIKKQVDHFGEIVGHLEQKLNQQIHGLRNKVNNIEESIVKRNEENDRDKLMRPPLLLYQNPTNSINPSPSTSIVSRSHSQNYAKNNHQQKIVPRGKVSLKQKTNITVTQQAQKIQEAKDKDKDKDRKIQKTNLPQMKLDSQQINKAAIKQANEAVIKKLYSSNSEIEQVVITKNNTLNTPQINNKVSINTKIGQINDVKRSSKKDKQIYDIPLEGAQLQSSVNNKQPNNKQQIILDPKIKQKQLLQNAILQFVVVSKKIILPINPKLTTKIISKYKDYCNSNNLLQNKDITSIPIQCKLTENKEHKQILAKMLKIIDLKCQKQKKDKMLVYIYKYICIELCLEGQDFKLTQTKLDQNELKAKLNSIKDKI